MSTQQSVNIINVDESDKTLYAILFAILLVTLTIAAMYFCKHFKGGQKSRAINPVVDDVDPWLTYTCTAPLPPFDRVPNPPEAEMLYTSPACTTFSRAEEARKFKCRFVFKGTPAGDPRDDDYAEYQQAVKKEFAKLKDQECAIILNSLTAKIKKLHQP